MPKYRTLDQHIKYRGEYIPPYTEVDVPTEDVSVWDKLVARKLAEKPEEEEPDDIEEPLSPEEEELLIELASESEPAEAEPVEEGEILIELTEEAEPVEEE